MSLVEYVYDNGEEDDNIDNNDDDDDDGDEIGVFPVASDGKPPGGSERTQRELF